MFSKVFTLAAIALTFTAQVQAHAAIAPALGLAAAPKRSDVQRPSTAKGCGNVNVAQTINTSTPVVAAADGSFTVTVTNFNGGRDGSRQVTMTVDATGAGTKFVAGTVTKNGQAAPASTGSEQITAKLPAGTKCTGGSKGNLCVASFKTIAGFGNCVVVQQGGAAAAASNTTAAAGANTAATGTKNNKGNKDATGAKNAAGTKAASAAKDAAGTKAATGGNRTLANTGSSNSTTTATGAAADKNCDKDIKAAIQAKIDELKAAFKKTIGTRAPRALRELDLAVRELQLEESS
jgi:hypothetical protein